MENGVGARAFNDTYGHLAGDELLRRAAESWRSVLRNTDFIARHGGEEFAVLLSDCSPEEARETVGRLRGCVPSDQTCSVGLGLWDGSESGPAFTERADAALYAAMRTGRNRVVVAAMPGEVAAMPG